MSATAAEDRLAGAAKGPAVLVVDDDATTRLLVTRTLADFGLGEVLEAGDGRAAQEILQAREDVSLVITDLIMPELDGLGLLRWGRQRYPDVAWVILSGVETFDAAAEAVRLGAFDFMTKPPQVQQLLVVVRNALEQQTLRWERLRLNEELAAANLELADRVAELESKSQLLQRDLERAEVIQRALLPHVPPALEQYCIRALYRPGAYVGGDLYDVVPIGRRYVGIYVADATGHGVTAAMLSVLFKQRLLCLAAEDGSPIPPAEVLSAANRALGEAVAAPGLFLTAAYVLIDLEEQMATLASAGHPPVLHIRGDGAVTLLRRTGPALGLVRDAQYGEERLALGRGDRLMLYTDGLLPGDGATESALADVAGRLNGDPDAALKQLLVDGGSAERNPDESDDVTVLVIEGRAGTSRFDNGAAAADGSARPTAAQSSQSLLYGESEQANFIAVHGRLVWTQCDALYEAARAFREEGRRLSIDLGECEYLDSTALGTIHELVTAGGVELQRLTESVRAMFDELSMDAALAAVRPAALPLPPLEPLQLRGGSRDRRRVREAHEALAALSDRNREAFRGVLEALRQDG